LHFNTFLYNIFLSVAFPASANTLLFELHLILCCALSCLSKGEGWRRLWISRGEGQAGPKSAAHSELQWST